ncbi:hypothetical protein [Clostridium sp. MD294]|uniref:hypothetical protein n=1 Tax=Clostridium sp. MD294 TaxID=97138 RepID=UPI0002CCBDA3|nr:hypothetical protein [Clostridium sp. MD294]NDO45332.1 hypothetical protein [Clostridium sp. MD294]USF31027.1 hypothetical protein C820_002473 [Clostridium sp. MD294]
MEILAESRNYIVFYEFESVILKIKKSKKEILIGDFYGEPKMALISEKEDFCAVCGCGIIIYYLHTPFIEYEYNKKANQWKEWGRNNKIIWIESIKYIYDFMLEIKTESGKIIKINPYTLSIK